MRILSILSLCLLVLQGQANPLWLRYPSISPDGKEIAFSYKGDIYKVPVAGGDAKQITMHTAHDYMPVWSPDGKSLAFASDRHGNFDIFIIPSSGGDAKRLTYNSAAELPYSFTSDGKNVIFGASILVPAKSAGFPTSVSAQLYKVPVTGGKYEQLLGINAENARYSKDGKILLYQDKKGYEDKFRKKHTSSITRDIWTYEAQGDKYKQLTKFIGEDTDPVFSPDNSRIFYLSEQNGTYNIHSLNLNSPDEVKQETDFKENPVRFLSIAQNETLCFSYDGEIYTKQPDQNPKKVIIKITGEDKINSIRTISGGGSASALTTDGKQLATISRGEIFVSGVDYKYTKRITNTPEREGMVDFSPDGKTLVYATQREGTWNLYTAKTAREEETYFFNATLIDEKPLFKASETERINPQYSPDGKEIAFIQDRSKLMVVNLASNKVRQITDGKTNFNTSGMINYEWSPDSKWFTLMYVPNKHDPYYDIGLVSSQGGKITNLTGSGYMNVRPRWVLDGNAILFISERYGMRNHASWGSLNDAMIIFMNQEAMDKFKLSKDEFSLAKEADKSVKKPEDDKSKEDDKDKKAKKAEVKSKDIVIELNNIEDRILRLTPNSSEMGDAILTKEYKLYYTAAFEKGYDLWSVDCRTRDIKLEKKDAGMGGLQLDKDEKNLFILGTKNQKIAIAGGKTTPIVTMASFDMDLYAEREYMFNHVWAQELKRFYTTTMHGVDWPAMKKTYSKFLPHINNNHDFAEMLSEMLGELNVSHTGGRFINMVPNADVTADLGLLYSWEYSGEGIKIDEVLEKSPFDNSKSKVKAGCIIEKINGNKIVTNSDFFVALNKKVGQNTLVTVYNPETKARWDEVVKPINRGVLSSLLYNRWIKQRAADVERLSNGRLGYVHIQSMSDESFRSVYSDILGKYNDKEGIVIDTRNNGGGRLHEDIEVLFSGKKYFTQMVRGEESCDMPSRRWNKPSIMLICENNYSNAHGTPWVYKYTNIGKLVGMPVPGTMTSVSWETLQDPSLVFGIPVIGYKLPDGGYTENTQLEPDVKVSNYPAKLVKGEDEQLAAAVRELLKDLK